MRISTSQMFASNIAGYQNGYSSIVKTQQQISSGVRIQTPADDPVGAARLLQLEQQQAQLGQYKGNLETAKNSLLQEESILNSVNDMLQRARELALSAGNGSYSDLDRNSVAAELDQIQQQLLNSMNSRDANGQYLFGGAKSSEIPFTQNPDGSYGYAGDQGSLELQVSSSMRLSSNDSGWSVFENVVNNARTETQLTAVPAGGQKATMGQGVVSNSENFNNSFQNSAPYVIELTSSTEYKVFSKTDPGQALATGTIDPTKSTNNISFRGVDFALGITGLSKDSSANLDTQLAGHQFELRTATDQFSVSGQNASNAQLSSGKVVDSNAYTTQFPASGIAVKFTSATEYDVYAQPISEAGKPIAQGALNGSSLTYAGVQLQVSGTPQVGDQLNVSPKPQTTQGILDTLSNLSKALKTPATGNESAQFKLSESLNLAVRNIDSAMARVDATRSSIGARLNTVETLTVENESLGMTNKSTQSDIRDTDMAEASSKLILQQTMLEAAQASFARVSQLSLFDKL
ncbi:flagellar hook-associated protein 3 [Pseudomonas luteola]|uniref:flagellar hook-associated protein 3 n=1 Tax=Pseudomonas luteola TaxID=47886 RepID=UPI00123B869C|nr:MULTISPECIES: flagellar hook-associated protein 3 [Pseudomonas]MBA1250734.1 flagellar hook-associated protein 3 [Pseudomonas zeshuii]QEU29470.1 flagellar hook-associated protein 3 [Pseudomonas luteola]